jgi:hypothetical protein
MWFWPARPPQATYTVGVLRIGIFDLIAVVLVAIAVLMPAPGFIVEDGYAEARPSDLRIVAQAQARLAESPADGAEVGRLADTLVRLNQHQDALRQAGESFEAGGGWRAAIAVSVVHADRVEVGPALDWANKALAACDGDRSMCPEHDRVRISLYQSGMQAGLESGVDPRLQPEAFRKEVRKSLQPVRIRTR